MFLIHRVKKIYNRAFKKNYGSDQIILNMRSRGISIGENCRIFTNIQSLEPTLIKIGNNVTISSNVSFCTHDNAIIKVINGKTDVVGEIKVGDNCFIGMNSILMYGITLGDGCIVGAGSVVTKSFPQNTVLAGNPAKKICTTEEYAEKYKKYAINFKDIPLEERAIFFETHPELIVRK